MTCKHCGAQIAPEEKFCRKRACMEREALEIVKGCSTGEVWACIAMVQGQNPKRLTNIDRATGAEAISAIREYFSPYPETREEAEKAIEWVEKCMEAANT